jgi:anti-sigma B factor antagonist
VRDYLSVALHVHEDSVLVQVAGELDLGSAPELQDALDRARDAARELIVVDLRKLEFIDMAGLRVLLSEHNKARRRARRLVLVNVGRSIRRVLELARATEVLTIAHPD